MKGILATFIHHYFNNNLNGSSPERMIVSCPILKLVVSLYPTHFAFKNQEKVKVEITQSFIFSKSNNFRVSTQGYSMIKGTPIIKKESIFHEQIYNELKNISET